MSENTQDAPGKKPNESKGFFKRMSKKAKVTIGVAYGTDINRVRQLLVNSITPMMRKNKSGRDIVSTKKGINVLVSNFGDNSIDLLVVYWTLVEEKTVFDLKVKETIYNTLNEAHVEIPFPQRDLYIKSMPEEGK